MFCRKSAITTLLLLAATLAFSAAPVGADPVRQEGAVRSMTVTGYGVAYGAPDVAYLNLGVESANQDIAIALDDASARMEAALAALKDAGVAPEDIRTTMYSVYQETPPSPVPVGLPEGAPESAPAPQPGAPAPTTAPLSVYHVSTSVEVTVRDTGQVATLLTAAINAGANAVGGIRFDIADRASLESDARAAAVEDARARAEGLASALGVTLGDVLEVVEGGAGYPTPFGGGYDARLAVSVPPVSEGSLSVSVILTVTFAIV